jgi:hypothetical protein
MSPRRAAPAATRANANANVNANAHAHANVNANADQATNVRKGPKAVTRTGVGALHTRPLRAYVNRFTP